MDKLVTGFGWFGVQRCVIKASPSEWRGPQFTIATKINHRATSRLELQALLVMPASKTSIAKSSPRRRDRVPMAKYMFPQVDSEYRHRSYTRNVGLQVEGLHIYKRAHLNTDEGITTKSSVSPRKGLKKPKTNTCASC